MESALSCGLSATDETSAKAVLLSRPAARIKKSVQIARRII